MNRGIAVLQTAALPLGYAAPKKISGNPSGCPYTAAPVALAGLMERETGFEPATSTLARLHSTTELFPPWVPNALL